jgi:hypothetical protein
MDLLAQADLLELQGLLGLQAHQEHRVRLELAEAEDLLAQAVLLERVVLLELAEAGYLLGQAGHQVLLGQADHQDHLELAALLGLEEPLIGLLISKELYMEQIVRLS